MDGPVSVRRIYTDLVELGPSLFNVVRKGSRVASRPVDGPVL